MEEVTDNVYLYKFPLNLLGCKMGRVVTVLRLESGQTFIHSTADFTQENVRAIRQVGEPGWLFEATNFHDTAAAAGRSCFETIPYIVPPGFSGVDSLGGSYIAGTSYAFSDEVEFFPIGGLPKLGEHIVFHRPSKTLIVADLFFNLPDSVGNWTKWFLKTTVGLKSFPGQSAYFRRFIEDQDAYRSSIENVAKLDFERIIVGHGDPILKDAKQTFCEVLEIPFTASSD